VPLYGSPNTRVDVLPAFAGRSAERITAAERNTNAAAANVDRNAAEVSAVATDAEQTAGKLAGEYVNQSVKSPLPPVRKDNEFRRAYRKGQSRATPRLVMYVLKRFPPKPKYGKDGKVIKAARIVPKSARVGITIGGKIGNAIVRNKLRRRFKEICRLNADRLKDGFDIVIVARDAAVTASYFELNRDVLYLADKLNVTVDAPRHALR